MFVRVVAGKSLAWVVGTGDRGRGWSAPRFASPLSTVNTGASESVHYDRGARWLPGVLRGGVRISAPRLFMHALTFASLRFLLLVIHLNGMICDLLPSNVLSTGRFSQSHVSS